MDVSFTVFLPSATKMTLNERFSNLETTCQKVDDDTRFVRVVSAAAERFEASKNQRLALQMANRIRFQDDSRATLDTLRDDYFAEVRRRPPRKSVAQRLSYVPGRVTKRRPSAKARLSLPAAAAVGRQRTTAGDGAVAGFWTRRLRARKKGVVSTALESSQVFWAVDMGRGLFPTNRTGFSAVSKPANSLTTDAHTQTAVAGFETVIGRRRRLEANALVVSAPAQPTQQKPSGNHNSLRPGRGRALSSTARGRRKGRGPRKGRGIGKVATDAAALDRELDEYMSHAKLALA